jgi:O-antigen/teichoic acid export membrane protein
VRKSLQIALLYGAACGGVLFLTARELCISLYGSHEAGQYLRWFAPLAVLLYCDAVTDAMIKGLGQQTHSVRYNIITNIMDVALLFLLLPKLGIFGYFLSFLVTHVINYALSLRRLLYITKERIGLQTPLLTLFSSIGAVWVASFVPTVGFRAAAYLVILLCLLFLLGILDREDLRWLIGLIRKK